MNDAVHSPSHYADGGIECIDAMRAAFHPSEVAAFCKLNAFKYIWRAGKKGDTVEDLEKAQVYLGWTIDATREDEPVPAEGSDVDEQSLLCIVGNGTHGDPYRAMTVRERAQREYHEGMERAAGRLNLGDPEDVALFIDGKELPGVVLVSFETDLHPSICGAFSDECCTGDDEATETAASRNEKCSISHDDSVGSRHEAPTDSPHPDSDPRTGDSADALGMALGRLIGNGIRRTRIR